MAGLFEDLKWRGLVHQVTDAEFLPGWLDGGSRIVYAGFDPTADSLHVGSLLPLLMLRRFQKAGHRPIALVGGATGMIGDPSGKSAERNLLSVELLKHNVDCLGEQMSQFLDLSDGKAKLLNNFDWMGKFSYLEFLRDVGKHFPVNVMLAKDSVRSRIERDDAGISYTEFSYMLLQAYDFVHLSDEHGCELQIGGSDQWGNITAGIDLGRRMRGRQLYGMTNPLLLKSDGTKMGKTEKGAIYLSAARTTPYHFFQYWINVADADAGTCLRFLTELPREEIKALDASRNEAPHKKESQRRLAETLTQMVHGDTGLASAQKATDVFFGREITPEMAPDELLDVFADVPSKTIAKSSLEGDGMTLLSALCDVKLANSQGEARRSVEQGGVYVNNQRQSDVKARLTTKSLIGGQIIVLRRGKKDYGILRLEDAPA
jgi:tyrosyl-tRNA synthetase